jgi:hypothetical protein
VLETRRYLGLELAGAKNQKTALAALEFYPKERKIFLLDIFDRISQPDGHEARGKAGARTKGVFALTTSGDEALLELIEELTEGAPRDSVSLAVNVPLQLPPAITACARKGCGSKPSVEAQRAARWMYDAHRKAERQQSHIERVPRVTEYTTYTQRPVELWVRYQVLSRLPESHRFEVDETLGGNKAPLTARMNFIRRHLGDLRVLEAWPKLTVACLAEALELPRRTLEDYRQLDKGLHAREEILEKLTDKQDVFIYERDVRKLAASLAAFDAFVCAYTAYLADTHRCAKIPTGFPVSSGWVHYPQCSSMP